MQRDEDTENLRKRLLRWHYRKVNSINLIELLSSNYQIFRHKVRNRLNKENGKYEDIDYREAIKYANIEELQRLDNIILEEKLGI